MDDHEVVCPKDAIFVIELGTHSRYYHAHMHKFEMSNIDRSNPALLMFPSRPKLRNVHTDLIVAYMGIMLLS